MSLRIYRRVKEWTGERRVECRAVRVYDGDGFLAAGDSGRFSVRIWGIDAPELGQEFFGESKKALHAMVCGVQLWCTAVCVDIYGRRVCVVQTSAGVDVGLAMVRMGLAWWYRSSAVRAVELRDAEKVARAGGFGLWAITGAERPWVYRRRNAKTVDHTCGLRRPANRRKNGRDGS